MKTIHPLILICLVGLSVSQAAEIIVAPNGSSSGDGSLARPLDLATALSSSTPARPGDTILLRGGRYIGKFTSSLNGTSSAPITVRSYSGEWAILDSGTNPDNRANILNIKGSWGVYRDFEVMSSDPKRESIYTGSYGDDIKRGEGVYVLAPNTRVINLIVHDAAQGIAVWSAAPNSEVYGCLIYNNGWRAPDRSHGHGIYSQNEEGYKLIRDNIVFNQFEKGIQIYGSSAAALKNFVIEGNTVFNNGILSTLGELSENLVIYGGATGPEGIVVRNNHFYGKGFGGKLLVGGEGAKDLIFQGNYVPHLTRIRYWQQATVTGNTFVRDTSMLELYTTQDPSTLPYVWNNNVYLGQELKYTPYGVFQANADGTTFGRGLYFDGWRQATTFDSTSRYSKSAPSGTRVIVTPNAYETGRATITVYNWNRDSVVGVDFAGVVLPGQSFEVRNAQNYFAGPVVSGTYEGAPVLLPMSGLGIAQPVGVAAPAETGPEFNVFIVRATGPVKAANTAPAISPIPDQSILQDTIAGPLSFTISDQETTMEKLSVLASSSNPTLVPNSNISVSPGSSTCSLTVKPANGQSGKCTITLTVTDGSLLSSTSFGLTVTKANTAPVISSIQDQSIVQDSVAGPIAFTIGDAESSADALALTAHSSNSLLVPNANIAVGGSGANRSITIQPAAGQTGTTTVTVWVSDGALLASTSFSVAVSAKSFGPTIASVGDQVTDEDIALGPVTLSISDSDTAASDLRLWAMASDTALVPSENIQWGGTASNPTLTIMPASNASGTTTISVVVSDGELVASTSFNLTVNPVNDYPTQTRIADREAVAGESVGPIPFTISDPETPADELIVRTYTSDEALISKANVVLGGSGHERTITVTPNANASGRAKVYVIVTDGSKTVDQGFWLDIKSGNRAPTISAISNQVVQEDNATTALAFTIADIETAPSSLTVRGSSSDPALVPDGNILFSGSDGDRMLVVVPAPDAYGTVVITVTVSDGVLSSSTSFSLTIEPENDYPTISSIPPQKTHGGESLVVPFTIGDAETPADELRVLAKPANTKIVTTSGLVLGGSGANRTVTVTPSPNQYGKVKIYLIVTDGNKSIEKSFFFTSAP